MTSKEIKIAYLEYESLDQLSETDRKVAEAAIEATGSAYAPYSEFSVGAAVMLDDGLIVKGSNQENAAYPSGLCAERTAMFYASAEYPGKAMKTIAVAAAKDGKLCSSPATPCGSCRQVMAQYQGKSGSDLAIILVGSDKIWKFSKVDYLLPLIFDSI
ncbi:MAG: cytidine deaminase [Bacteroidales bacterium]|nr:cytidine deaminase [Bacteroidales bacterium]